MIIKRYKAKGPFNCPVNHPTFQLIKNQLHFRCCFLAKWFLLKWVIRHLSAIMAKNNICKTKSYFKNKNKIFVFPTIFLNNYLNYCRSHLGVWFSGIRRRREWSKTSWWRTSRRFRWWHASRFLKNSFCWTFKSKKICLIVSFKSTNKNQRWMQLYQSMKVNYSFLKLGTIELVQKNWSFKFHLH